MANWVLSVFSDRSKDVLEYNCPVWNPSLMQDIKKLESTQRAFTRYISGCQGLLYWDRLKKLGLMSLQRRRERYVILHLWKIWQGAVPNDLDIQFYDHTRLGTRYEEKLHNPVKVNLRPLLCRLWSKTMERHP